MRSTIPNTGLRTKALKRVSFQKKKQEPVEFAKVFSSVFGRGEITQNSIVIAYYLLLSIFPIIIIVGNLLPLLNVKTAPISRYLAIVFPEQVQSFIMPIIDSLLSKGSGGFISFGILIAVWAFSRLINSIRIAMNKIYGVRRIEQSTSIWTTLINRLVTFVATALLVFGLFIFVFVFAFGQQILEFLAPIFKFSMAPYYRIVNFKWPLILLVLVAVISYLNYFLPNISLKKRSLWPGVSVTLAGWVLLSAGFSLYLRYFGTSWSNYGIVGTFIIFMLWLNLSSLLLLFGVVVNSTIDNWRDGQVDYSAGLLVGFLERKRQQHRK